MAMAAENHRFWIDMSLECIRRDHTYGPGDQTGPFRTARALGMALAAFNEVNMLAAGRVPLMPLAPSVGLRGLSPAQLEVACCAACSEVLKRRYPAQLMVLDSEWISWLLTTGHGPVGSTEEMSGRAVGAAIHALGLDDPKYAAGNMYTPSRLPYTHAAPPNDPKQNFAGADWGGAARLMTARVKGFPPPPGRNLSPAEQTATNVEPTTHYKADFARVHAKGGINSGPMAPGRTLNEEFIGIAWGYDGPPNLGTPPRLYMQAVLSVLDSLRTSPPVPPAPPLTVAEELEVIAGVALAMAEAGIDAWHYKYAPTHMMWRPAVGIPKAVPADLTAVPPRLNNGTADPEFFPLGRPDTNKRGLALTPDFPAYPSGHATFGSAAFTLLRLYLAEKRLTTLGADGVDDIKLNFVSDEYNGVNTDPRTLKPRVLRPISTLSLWEAIVDNSVSRVYLGVHWQFDGITRRNAADTDDEFEAAPHANIKPNNLGKTGGVWLGGRIAVQVAAKLGVTGATIALAKL